MRKICALPEDFHAFNPPTVYRYYGEAGKLLYVGKSTNFTSRDMAHRERSRWRDHALLCFTEEFPSDDIAMAVEAVLIGDLNPAFNRKRIPAFPIYWGMVRRIDPDATHVSGHNAKWWRCPKQLYERLAECDPPEWADFSATVLPVERV